MKIGVIGGSGLYDIPGIENLRETRLETPFGSPSDAYIEGVIDGRDVVFLPRHGRGHHIMPSELNHRANIWGMKMLGVDAILSLSAVGSFREELAPGDIVVIDQFVDRTKRNLDHTFFGNGMVAHISFSHPLCAGLGTAMHGLLLQELAEGKDPGVSAHLGGTYLNMEGPAFSTLAESRLYRSWGMDVIGMTNLAEAKLAREAEICYQTLALVTDYDCWHETHGAVSVEMVIATLMKNADLAKRVVQRAVPLLPDLSACSCRSALKNSIITHPDKIPAATRKSLDLLVGKYLP